MRVILAICALACAASATPQQQVFRGGVDLVAVDVAVTSSDGTPLSGLTSADFTITAGGRPRRLVSVEFIAVRDASPVRAARTQPEPAAIPRATSNAGVAGGRTFLFIVDAESIRAGEGRPALESIAEYLDRLAPEDRAGLVTLPTGTPHADLTTNRAIVRRAAALVAGSSTRGRRPATMSMGEATYIVQGDRNVLAEFLNKEAVTDQELRTAQRVAERTLDEFRRHTRSLLSSLTALAGMMAPIEEPKTIVLVSEGLKTDAETRNDVRAFAEAAERARVTLSHASARHPDDGSGIWPRPILQADA